MKYLAFTLSPAVPRSIAGRYKTISGKRLRCNPPPLCCAQQNIGEVSEGQRG